MYTNSLNELTFWLQEQILTHELLDLEFNPDTKKWSICSLDSCESLVESESFREIYPRIIEMFSVQHPLPCLDMMDEITTFFCTVSEDELDLIYPELLIDE